MAQLDWVRILLVASALGLALLLVRVRASRWILGALLLVASVALGGIGVANWLGLDSFEKRVALGITSPDAKSPEAYWAQARARDAGVPLVLSLAAASAGIMLITWGVERRQSSRTRTDAVPLDGTEVRAGESSGRMAPEDVAAPMPSSKS